MFRMAIALFAAALPLAASQFTWKNSDGRVTLVENGKPALTFNPGAQLPAGVPEDRRRCCYIYPLWTPAGVSLTDDFPKDHYHHRGLFWSWPHVDTGSGHFDLWMLKGISPRNVSVRTSVREGRAHLDAVNEWVAAEKPIVREHVRLTVHPVRDGAREFDVELRILALHEAVTLSGSAETGKSYGGLGARFAPHDAVLMRSDAGAIARDEDLNPHAWAEFEAAFEGQRALLRITPDAANPGAPNQWCAREYGFLGASFPGRTDAVRSYTIQPGKPLVLRFRVRVADVTK